MRCVFFRCGRRNASPTGNLVGCALIGSYCANLLSVKTNGFRCLSVYHQNIKITCRGGVPPPVMNDVCLHADGDTARNYLWLRSCICTQKSGDSWPFGLKSPFFVIESNFCFSTRLRRSRRWALKWEKLSHPWYRCSFAPYQIHIFQYWILRSHHKHRAFRPEKQARFHLHKSKYCYKITSLYD